MRNVPDFRSPDDDRPPAVQPEEGVADDPPADLLDRYWLGQASPHELAWLEDWNDANPGQIERLTEVGNAFVSRGFHGYAAEARAKRVVEILRAAQVMTSPASHTSHSRAWRFWYGAAGIVASALLLLVGWSGAIHRLGNTLAAQQSIYTTGPGERATITLPDGSTVVLNVASRLEVPADYSTKNRTLHLRGEAFFAVKQDARTPFAVIAGPSTTRVLGTRFAVRYYLGDSVASVAVRDGKVAVYSRAVSTSSRVPTILAANQRVTIRDTSLSAIQIAQASQFSFTRGVLTLRDATLAQAIPELNRWYNADIRFGDIALADRRVEGRFVSGSVSDLAEVLEWTLGLRVVREGRVITLYPKAE